MADGRSGAWSGGGLLRAARAAALVLVATALMPPASHAWPSGRAPTTPQPEGRGLDRVATAAPAPPPAVPPPAVPPPPVPPPPAPTAGPAGPGPARSEGCTVRPVHPEERFDAFYAQVCLTEELPVLASAAVDSRALETAAAIVDGVLAHRPQLRDRMEQRGVKVAVLGRRERAVELPEYRDLPERYPDEDWDAARAYSATADRPLLTAPEENLACQKTDTYPGQQVLVHELGHSVLDLAVRPFDPTVWNRVVQSYEQARRAGRWVGYYGATSPAEYWAEGVQAYFDAGARSSSPDRHGTPVATREELAGYDPTLYELVREVFGDNPWRAPRCP